MIDQEEVINVSSNSCCNVTIEPVGENQKADVAFNNEDILSKFSDEPLKVDPSNEGVSKIKSFMKYITSDAFRNSVNKQAYKTGIPPRKLAQGFITKVLGTIGDVLGITIDTVHATVNGIIDILSSVLRKGVSVITNVARAIARVITFNQTAVA